MADPTSPLRVTLERELARLQSELAGPPPDPGPPPVATGRRRVELLTRFHQSETMMYLQPGDVTDLVDADAREAVERGFAKFVEV